MSNVTAEMVLSVGGDNFLPQLTGMTADILYSDHITLFVFDHDFVPHFIGGTSREDGAITSKLSHIYESSTYYEHDPNLKWVGQGDKGTNIPLLQQLHAKDISNTSYRKNIYEDNGLLDRLSLIDHEKSRWFILNFYRNVENEYFSEKDIGHLQQEATLIAAFVKRHMSFSSAFDWDAEAIPAIDRLEKLVVGLGNGLSKREVQVCARVMQGMTREAVSLDLGLKQPTIATFMRRAYAKLNISSLNELFSLCLAQSGRGSH
ncbi:MAG: helix-turn-helix transcriptional regulator [Emcibacter sp.]|nr:helix-turn-helix transcriptional regulator [Emcibacter sp.]